MSSRHKFTHSDVSNLIDHRSSHNVASCMLNGENVNNVMLKSLIILCLSVDPKHSIKIELYSSNSSIAI